MWTEGSTLNCVLYVTLYKKNYTITKFESKPCHCMRIPVHPEICQLPQQQNNCTMGFLFIIYILALSINTDYSYTKQRQRYMPQF